MPKQLSKRDAEAGDDVLTFEDVGIAINLRRLAKTIFNDDFGGRVDIPYQHNARLQLVSNLCFNFNNRIVFAADFDSKPRDRF